MFNMKKIKQDEHRIFNVKDINNILLCYNIIVCFGDMLLQD